MGERLTKKEEKKRKEKKRKKRKREHGGKGGGAETSFATFSMNDHQESRWRSEIRPRARNGLLSEQLICPNYAIASGQIADRCQLGATVFLLLPPSPPCHVPRDSGITCLLARHFCGY